MSVTTRDDFRGSDLTQWSETMRRIRLWIHFIVCCTWLVSLAAFAASLEELAAEIDEPLQARTARGIIHSIDLDARRLTIGGYEYYFGPHTMPVKVTMRNSSAGAVELLESGMKVEVVYAELGASRIVASITELAEDARVEH